MIKDKSEAEFLIYRSYVNKIRHLNTNQPDQFFRHPINTRHLLDQLGSPDLFGINILVTGSKGKGSVSRMIAKILETHGYKVGLFTSPHLIDFNERIRIDGKAISDEDLVAYAQAIEETIQDMDSHLPDDDYLGPVGITLAIALQYFHDHKTQINVIECGKGARFDDVAVIKADLSVINTVFLEHVPALGYTLSEIAANKAGVIKQGQRFCFSALQKEEVKAEIEKEAQLQDVEVRFGSEAFGAENVRCSSSGTTFDVWDGNARLNGIETRLLGRHQADNAALAIAVCDQAIVMEELKIKKAFKDIVWPGRLEVIHTSPTVIVDGCIHLESYTFVREVLNKIDHDRLLIIVGIPDDKDYQNVIKEAAEDAAHLVITASVNPHLKFSGIQKQLANDENILYIPLFTQALKHMISLSQEKDLIVILGTQSVVKEAKDYYHQSLLDL